MNTLEAAVGNRDRLVAIAALCGDPEIRPLVVALARHADDVVEREKALVMEMEAA